MTKAITGNTIRGNILFALTVYVVFLLLFENKLAIPVWLQPVGRLHAMFVHFPIVIVLLALILDAFTPRNESSFYSVFSRNLLFAGSALSGVTVVMGVFLSREDGYEGDMLMWHKWWGVTVFLLSVLIYAIRTQSWFTTGLARASAVVTALAVIIAGHLGGSLTHGDDYILAPIARVSQPEVVSPEDAIVFDHVIKPIFESKCRSCHNPLKVKGKLILTDSASIMKGGKSGELLVAGNPHESLLLHRIQLPLEEKKHMPPSDRPQLSSEEEAVLYEWVRSGAPFNKSLTSYAENDSFRIVVTRLFDARQKESEQYDFLPAEPSTLAQLNSNYRVVRPVSRNSPALAVNIYNRALYSPTTVEELKEVRQQVIALDLSKMPVVDSELQHIARLQNLRKLNLNFTAITGDGLTTLASLEQLEHLSIAGTNVSYEELKAFLARRRSLKTVALWETPISSTEVRMLQEEFPDIEILGVLEGEMELIKLNPPTLKNKSRVFRDTISLILFHPVRDTEIRFTTDGSDPDSLTSPIFESKTVIDKTTIIKARAFKKDWLSSEVGHLNVYRRKHQPDTVMLLSKLNRVHVQKGAITFFDNELGTFNANSPAWANNWGGVRNNNLELLLRYDEPRQITTVSFNCLIETENSIFPPESVELWGGSSEEDLRLIARVNITLPTVYRKPYIELFDVTFEAQEVSWLKIVAKPVMKLPEWHKNKGRPAFLLVDEILVN